MTTIEIAALLFAPLPGLAIHLLGRRILRQQDDPGFTEKFWRHRIKVAQIAMTSFLALVALAWRWTPVTLPVFALCAWCASYPVRKTVFNEEWTLGEYLRSRMRLTFGLMAFWLVLLFEPMIVGLVGLNNWGWVVAAMIVWSFFVRTTFLWAFEAGPLTDVSLLPRFDAILARSTALRPEILEIGTPKAHFPNAFASPHPKKPRILMSRTLLRHLEPDEIGAIFAHEVAHLEHYSPKRIRVAGWAMFVLIIVGAVMPLLTESFSERNGAAIGQLIWTFAVLIGLIARQRRHQGHEGHSDLRAVELCGDPEALIRALTKLHVLGRTPRRWDSAREANYSHPSLARRIQAIRKAAGTAIEPPNAGEPLVIAKRNSAATITLGPDAVAWSDGRTLRYSELAAMHVRPTLGGPVLVAKDANGKSWSTPIGEGDVAAVEAFLDRADLHFATKAPAPSRPLNIAALLGRLVAVIVFIGGLVAGARGATATIAAMIAIVLPTTPILLAMGAAALASQEGIVIFGGLVALIASFMQRQRTRATAGRDTLIVVGVLLMVFIPIALLMNFDFARMHRIGLLVPMLAGIGVPLLLFTVSSIWRTSRGSADSDRARSSAS